MNQEIKPVSNPFESKINSIQVLRAAAALTVTIYHLKDVIGKGEPFKQELDFFFNSGPSGVALFFVISGFIMVYITKHTTFSWLPVYKFMARRFIRIWPTYAIITLLYFLFQSRIGLQPGAVKSLILSLLFIPVTHTDPPFYGYAFLPVGWTLNYEIYFYALVAISMFFSRFRWYVFFVIVIITLIVIPITLGYITLETQRTADYGNGYLNMVANPIIWNFVYGVIIGLVYMDAKLFPILASAFARTWLVFLFIFLALWQYWSGFFGGLGPSQWGFGSSLLFTAFIFYNARRPINFPEWLVKIGDMSFSIYLVHMPIVVILGQFFKSMGYPVYSTGTAMFFLSLFMTMVASYLSYQYLELRLSTYLKQFLPFMKRK
ncbi:acyltransferase [Dyadobacter sp. CY347]|uniref:acyltransferase family protein n=1 Tax=Dyadobacter sp. CY347 TaxID=2909336 RepID=UPI001F43052D|nr:acyltransferase [Dyadobacter sp. CY347]MCF2487967.1 acyltransferase [Dyadobacter sp. CY347]